MKPLRLKMKAFGPYAKEEVINFELLENRTMFVISGKTGSGKTTIFDGISFAIYGRTSGDERTGTELRSHFAADDTATEVSLKFSLKGRTYEIRRAPQQEKKKERGEGYRVVNAIAELYEITDSGERKQLGASVREVDEKIKEIMQLDANQFRQILMIPQGEFRKLLIADSKEKEKILQRLFHTQFYKQIEEKLKQNAAALKNQVQASMELRTQRLKSIQASSEEMAALLQESPLNERAILVQLAKEIQQLAARSEELKQMLELQHSERDQLTKQLDEAERVIKQMERLEQLNEQWKKLQEHEPVITGKQNEIDWAEKAAKLERQEKECTDLREDLDSLQQRADRTKEERTRQLKRAELAQQAWEREQAKENERELAAERVSQLTAMKPAVDSLEKEKQALERLSKRARELEGKRVSAAERCEKTEKELERIEKELAALDQWQTRLYQEEAHLQQTRKYLQLVRDFEQGDKEAARLSSQLTSLQKEHQEKQQRLTEARDKLGRLEASWDKHQAGLLASRLISGTPCPVCGSTDHPAPAAEQAEGPVKEEIEAAKLEIAQIEKEWNQLEKALIESKTRLELGEAALKKLQTEAGDYSLELTKDAIENQKRQLCQTEKETKTVIREAKEKLNQKAALLEAKDRLKEQRRMLQQEMLMCQEHEANAQKAFISKRSEVEQWLKQIPEELRQKDRFEFALDQALKQKRQLAEQLEMAAKNKQAAEKELATVEAALKEMDRMIKQRQAQLDRERIVFINLMKQYEFKDYTHYASSKRTEAEIKQIQQQIQSFREEIRSVSDRLKELEEALKGIERPEVESVKLQLDELERKISEAQDKRSSIEAVIRDSARIQQEVESLNESLKELESDYSLIGNLYDIAHGNNTHKLTFERFVLAAFLDEILELANERLVKMTNGRYRLLRKTGRAKGNAQSGLEILVSDQYTGQTRHVKTLSGGESFKASLALALGMADVVQQYAGGVSLETMFIDEGFGTLDPESLDQAIAALMDIQSSGRLVGIISHVPELKERIDARLEVISTQSGSFTRFQFCHS